MDTSLNRVQAETAVHMTDAEIMDAWLAGIAARIARRLLVFELIDCETTFDDLIEEWQLWQRIRRAHEWFAQFDAADRGGADGETSNHRHTEVCAP